MATRVLVTGAAGAVGEETVAELLRHGDAYEVVVLDLPCWRTSRRLRPFKGRVELALGDMRNPEDVERACQGVQAVIHLAAVIPPRADHEPEVAEAVNVNGTQNLVTAMEQLPEPPRLIHTSSISVYGDRLAEPWINVGDPVKPSPGDRYGETKVRAEELIQRSGLQWSIYRLTGVMSRRVGMDPLMFHMPLDTSLEIITARDTARALVRALEVPEVDGRIFNLGGGPRCRASYRDYLDKHLTIMGLGTGFFPDAAFAEGNFHCGYYGDSEDTNRVLDFQHEGIEEWLEQVRDQSNPLVPPLARALRPMIRWYLLSQSEPLAARRTNDEDSLKRFKIAAPN